MSLKAVSLQLSKTTFDRLSRRMALSGVINRREAEKAIINGEVEVDGTIIKTNIILHDHARVFWRGLEIPMNIPTMLWGVAKPKHILCSLESGEKFLTLRDYINKCNLIQEKQEGRFPIWLSPHINIVRGLDMNKDGLVLLTNDGRFAQTLRSSTSRIQTIYKLKVFGTFPAHQCRDLWKGLTLNGIHYGPVWIELLRRNIKTSWIQIRLIDGPERCLDTLLDYFHLKILSCKRYAFGPITVSQLPENGYVSLISIPRVFEPLIPKKESNYSLIPAKGCLTDMTPHVISIFDNLKETSSIIQ